ncbi:MAG: hypothetical protein KF696_11245 [Planctomycetes bacterium]|nr:hypothetical protein [Planctomycetota bacterium]MCW8135773.1 hypothetical protein [Planctomycetota bacterium]
MLEFLESLEPYSSYRFLLGLVLTGMTIYWLATSLGSLRSFRQFVRELNMQVNDERLMNDVRRIVDPEFDLSVLPPLKARPGQIVKLTLLSAVLRMVSFRTLCRVWPELVGCALLLPACGYSYWLVFSAEL